MKYGIKYLHILSLTLIVATACQTSPKKTKLVKLQHITSKNSLTGPWIDVSQLSSEQKEQLGFFLFDPVSQKVLDWHNPDQFFIPASTNKVPSTLAALHILGGDYRFHTDLSYTGKIKNHVLYGDLYLKGTGDPVLKTSHLINFAHLLAKKGIQKVSGNFYYDESLFKTEEAIEDIKEPWARYNMGVSALSVDFNQVSAHWKPALNSSQEQYQIYSVPDLPFLSFDILPRSLSEETPFIYEGDDKSMLEHWLLSENQAHEGSATLPIKKPGLVTATIFSKLCEMEGIALPSPLSGVTPASTRRVATHNSPPAVELAEGALEYSNNLTAELLQLAAAQHLVKKPVGKAEAAEIIKNWLIQKTKISSFEFKNGSGLSSLNRFTPRQFVALLGFADGSEYSGRTYESLLPISGLRGDIRNRLSHPSVALRIRGKAGSMNYTHALAGYLYTSSGKRLAFAIMSTNFDKRKLLDQSPNVLSSRELRGISVWGKAVRKLEDDLLVKWVSIY